VLAPAAAKTGFGMVNEYDYDQLFETYHTSRQVAQFFLNLYDSDQVLELVDRETFAFKLYDPRFPYAGNSQHNQKMNRRDID